MNNAFTVIAISRYVLFGTFAMKMAQPKHFYEMKIWDVSQQGPSEKI